MPLTAARLVTLALVLLVAAGSGTLFADSSQLGEASFFSDIANAKEVLEQMTCLAEHQTAIDVCQSLTFPFYRLQALLIEGDRRKESCCFCLSARHCMDQVANAYCGGLGQYTAAALDMLTEGEQCHDYQKVKHCTHPAFFLLLGFLLLAFVVFLIFVVLSIIKWLCG
ncbi:hypothetical protein TYRP_011390 [Tyrophagus putrescentiae]|nr:hypothetical protein TYRP_011390 [Tyrophagus putrescentiae]